MWGTVHLGYRLHPVDGGSFQFRIGAMAIGGQGLSLSDSAALSDGAGSDEFGVVPWLYLSLGAGF